MLSRARGGGGEEIILILPDYPVLNEDTWATPHTTRICCMLQGVHCYKASTPTWAHQVVGQVYHTQTQEEKKRTRQ